MRHLSKLLVFSFLFGVSGSYFSQVGIVTSTPTETVDVNGTLRVRDLPVKGEKKVSTIGQDQVSDEKQVFKPTVVVVADNNGVVGKKSLATLVSEAYKANFNTTDDSSALFVIKRYNVGDWPSGGQQFDTGMSISKWEAFLSGWQTDFSNSSPDFAKAPGILRGEHGFRLIRDKRGTWRLRGDIPTAVEKQYLDVLFIKKRHVSYANGN